MQTERLIELIRKQAARQIEFIHMQTAKPGVSSGCVGLTGVGKERCKLSPESDLLPKAGNELPPEKKLQIASNFVARWEGSWSTNLEFSRILFFFSLLSAT